ncbi:50S ribosomal protein L11 methyltransferase [Maricaulaceae bacterium EIL42A08]|nr:50S ribosomal protein L11 methyltransferase [Maricaulaceae bacterium EIL42A08]
MSTVWRLTVTGPIQPLLAAGERLNMADPAPALGWSVFEDDGDETHGYIEVLFADRIDETAFLTQLGLTRSDLEAIFMPLPEEDWIAMSLAGLPSVEAGRFLVHGEHTADDLQPHHISLLIEAGPAFGTGHHGTTLGCLKAMDKLAADGLQPTTILDLGTGTGLLAIAAKKLWPDADILATDIDPVSVDETLINATKNSVSFAAETADGFDHAAFEGRTFNLILANILAGPLIELAPQVVARLEDGGTVVLSGLLEEQAEKVTAAYVAEGLSLKEQGLIEGWGTLVLQ